MGTNGTHRSCARCHPYPIPQPVKVGHTTGVYVPYSFRTVVWVLLRPTWTDQWKCCQTGPTVFRPYPRRLESLTICRCQRPWVSARPGFEPATSRSADRRSPNWVNQAAVEINNRPGFEPATSRSADRRSPNWANQEAVQIKNSKLRVTLMILISLNDLRMLHCKFEGPGKCAIIQINHSV